MTVFHVDVAKSGTNIVSECHCWHTNLWIKYILCDFF